MADQPITGLPTKTASGVASTDKMLGIDSAEGYQILVRDVAKYIIENCDVSTLAGAVRTPKAAIDLLDSNLNFAITVTKSGSAISNFMSDIANGIISYFGTSADRTILGYVLITGVDTFLCAGNIRNGALRLSVTASNGEGYDLHYYNEQTTYNKHAKQAEVDTLNSKTTIATLTNTSLLTWAESLQDGCWFFRTNATVSDIPVSFLFGYVLVKDNNRHIFAYSMTESKSFETFRTNNLQWSSWIQLPARAEIDALNSKTEKTLTFVSGLEVTLQENYLFGNGLKQIAVQLHSTDNIPVGTNICTLPADMRQAENSFKPVFILDTNNATIYAAYMMNEITLKKAIPAGLYLSILIVYY